MISRFNKYSTNATALLVGIIAMPSLGVYGLPSGKTKALSVAVVSLIWTASNKNGNGDGARNGDSQGKAVGN